MYIQNRKIDNGEKRKSLKKNIFPPNFKGYSQNNLFFNFWTEGSKELEFVDLNSS